MLFTNVLCILEKLNNFILARIFRISRKIKNTKTNDKFDFILEKQFL